jgi:CRISPR-associated protein Csx10
MTDPTVTRLTVTLRQRAQVSDRARSDFVLGTLTHLPGAVVRGAFAARWLSVHGGPSEPGTPPRALFENLFEGGVRFGPLFSGAPPQPLSLLVHKYPHTTRCPHVAIDRAAGEQIEPETVCPTCDSPWQPAKGAVAGPAPLRRTHVTIGPTQVAVRGGLVSRETLPVGASFTGTLVARSPDLIDALAGLGPIQVGGRRTTHGLAEAVFDNATGLPAPTRLPDGWLVMTLRSPGVFVDDLGRPSIDPNPGELSRVLGLPVRVGRRWARWVSVGGWHAASGLPKPVELAVAAGSTYVLEPSGPVADTALAALAARGLGLRRHEGFGEIGGAATVPPGRLAHEARQQEIAAKAATVAGLRGLQTRRVWPQLVQRLRAAAGGDIQAGQWLRRAAQQWTPWQRQALEVFLTFEAKDAADVLDLWR